MKSSTMKIKLCPFCGGEAVLRSPEKLRTRNSAICSSITCNKCGICDSRYWPWDKQGKELPRIEQDKLCIKAWNARK